MAILRGKKLWDLGGSQTYRPQLACFLEDGGEASEVNVKPPSRLGGTTYVKLGGNGAEGDVNCKLSMFQRSLNFLKGYWADTAIFP